VWSKGEGMIQVYGDSITVGSPGISYCHYLKKEIRFEKHGLGGDTVSGLFTRINSKKINSSDFFIIEIGTNDIMLPYLRSLSQKWQITINGIERSGRVISNSLDEFLGKYNQLMQKINPNKVAIISIPCIGENTNSHLNQIVDKYNIEISNICKKYNKYYIDFNTIQKKEIQNNQSLGENEYFIKNDPSKMIMDVVLTNLLCLSDKLSKKRKLITTVDGVHLNKTGASLLAKAILPFIK
jgi:lysophospholipase L1-like esterase